MTDLTKAIFPHTKQTLKVYYYYRLALGITLYIIYMMHIAGSTVGKSRPELFHWVILLYISFCTISLFAFDKKKFQNAVSTTVILLSIDVLCLAVLSYSSGSEATGINYLLLVTTATGAILLGPQFALGFAAYTVFLIFIEGYVQGLEEGAITPFIFESGVLGFYVFCTSGAFIYLSTKIRISTLNAEKERQSARYFQKMAENIVHKMRTGIVVIDENNQVELINEAAVTLLELDPEQTHFQFPLDSISPLKAYLNALSHHPIRTQIINIQAGHQIRIGSALLENEEQQKKMLFIEDNRQLIQQAQQLKLGSLGRLAASIAHEIRNPLGAISHASQLLQESPDLAKEDGRFVDIILNNTARVNQIIENTAIISRRKAPKPEIINLYPWLKDFISDYKLPNDDTIIFQAFTKEARVNIDPSNLRQILTNLFDNGLRYSEKNINQRKLSVQLHMRTSDDTMYLEIYDFGTGISQEDSAHIFEPFFTTDKQGSGLGLYICRELCEINHATISYSFDEHQQSCFTIHFSHYLKIGTL